MQHLQKIAPAVNSRRTGSPQVESLAGPVPLFVSLQCPGKPRCSFPFEGEAGWAFVADMEKAGWIRSIEGSHLVLTGPKLSVVGGGK